MGNEPADDAVATPVKYHTADVMVVGAGISGIQASLDLANSGFKVYLVDKNPAIGGHMAQFDKVFPTNDCSMCIESPKFVECDRHPNIKILTNAEVCSLKGEAGNFKVTLLKKPRYVIEEECRGCGLCEQNCPVNIPDVYNESLCKTKAAHIHFAQAVPLIPYIDPKACHFLLDKKCNICTEVCENKAINLNQKEEEIEIHLGAVILAPGYEIFDAKIRADYGYGKMTNVVTSLEYERMLNADGPYRGEIRRPSEGKTPKKIAWIQCVGSRQVTAGGKSYCSAVCCMYSIKQVILTKEHYDYVQATVFHNDIRAFGKEYEQFYARAKSMAGVQFVRSYVSVGREQPDSNNVTIKYSLNDCVKEEEFELVVLSVGLTPPQDRLKLAQVFGIELNPHGFCKTDEGNIVSTSRSGVFVSGAFAGPKDIPESVMTGSSAASLCAELLAGRRGLLAVEKVYPPERDFSNEEPKVGVFVCSCGANIGSVINVSEVSKYAATLPNVVNTEEVLFACSTDSVKRIAETIRDKGLNRVVVAACTPRTHEPLFQDTLREAGINKYGFVMANIREHCAWVHSREKDKATQKAKDKVRMATARAALLQPLREIDLPINKNALVLGAGLAGMTAALNLAGQGFKVYLVEKNGQLGGMASRLYYTLEGMDIQAHLVKLIHQVYRHPLINVYENSTVMENSGYVGNFVTKVKTGQGVKEIQHGVTIIATGAEEFHPTEYLYGSDERVVTLLELEEKIARGDQQVVNAQSMALILCVGCREEIRPYCSRVCCSQAIKCALKLKEINPTIDLSIIYRDMRTYGYNEDFYREASKKGVRFIRYEPSEKPVLEVVDEGNESGFRISLTDFVLEKRLVVNAEMISLAVPGVPASDNEEISRLFKVPLSRDGFFLEAHMKLRPVDFATEGVFLCGTAHFPKSISETISQAYAAAGRASTILTKDKIVSSGAVCEVNEAECNGCGRCKKACQYGAIDIEATPNGKKAKVTPAMCQSCGACNAVCPNAAITLNHFTDAQILAEINAASQVAVKKGSFEPRVVAFLCNWCGYAGSDMAGVSRMQFAPNAREIRVMCSSRIHPKFIYEAFMEGIDGVLICGCHLGDCHYMRANEQTETMVETTKKFLQKAGIDPERLRQAYISAAEGTKYAETVNSFTSFLTKVGPVQLNEEHRSRLEAKVNGS